LRINYLFCELINSSQVVIGFDGVNSCVASWMGLQKPEAVGQVGVRGMAIFPEGHKFEDKAQLFVGKGTRTAYLPTSPTKVFWFLVWNESAQGESEVRRASSFLLLS
jgi:2-polyprenyl-6-methoxyphenol hydroxylase-like FAD-dependent oxidoreductase